MGFQVWGSAISVSRLEHVHEPITFWLNQQEVQATVVQLDVAAPKLDALPSVEQGTLLLVLPAENIELRIHLANQVFDVLWLDDRMTTIDFTEVDPDVDHTLRPPEGARYGLVTRHHFLPDEALNPGYELLILNKGSLIL
jgi:hypothetical protein